ncbi:hypothetical protein SDC9_137855 [bioreactor metagenome]|uniref:Uncharacterized protein n=1 Tax=bioreactor metagenome TaxID=1076179 RepID=A0A645DPN6_9ZZZZ
MDKVAGLHVSPVHNAPFCGIRIMLIIEVVHAVVEYEPAGIVHPSAWRLGVKRIPEHRTGIVLMRLYEPICTI